MRNKRGALLLKIGLLLLAAALFLTVYNLYDGWRAQRSAGQALQQLATLLPAFETVPSGASEPPPAGETEIPDYVLNPDMEMPVQTIDGEDYVAILQIPALGLELPVINQWSYPRLKTAPCRYCGSAYSNNLVIAAHNYPSHFGALKDLQTGDEVVLTDMDGNVFLYLVSLTEVLNPDDVDGMTDGWDLTLFTCAIGGQFRVAVRCTLKSA